MKKFYLLLLVSVLVMSCKRRLSTEANNVVQTVHTKDTIDSLETIDVPHAHTDVIMYESGYIGTVLDYNSVCEIASDFYIVVDEGSTISDYQEAYLWGLYIDDLPRDYFNTEVYNKDTIYSYGQFHKVQVVRSGNDINN